MSHGLARQVRRSGTSFAAAVVSAFAARLLSVCRANGYNLDAIDIRDIILSSCVRCDDAVEDNCALALAGRLNVRGALRELHEIGAGRSRYGGPVAIGAREPVFTT